MQWYAGLIVDDGVGLQQLVHHAALSYIELEEPLFRKTAYLDQGIISDFVAIDRMILAERALVDPAVREDEIVFCHPAGTFKFFLWLQEYFWEYRCNPMGSDR